MSVTENEIKNQEGTCTSSSCSSSDKEKSAQQKVDVKAEPKTIAVNASTKKESCCGG